MSVLEFRPEKKGNVKEGGSVRVPGEEEPNVLEAKGLSQLEIEHRAENEAYGQKEMLSLAGILEKKGWRAADVLENQSAQDKVAKELPPQFRYGKLKEHLATLADREKNKRAGYRGN